MSRDNMVMRGSPDAHAKWEAILKELNRRPALGPDGPVDVAGLWADPTVETKDEFLARAALAYHAAMALQWIAEALKK